MNNIFKNHFYINLEKRPDRNKHAYNELSKLDIIPNRLNAIEHPIGIIGCALSHIKVINEAKKYNWDYVCVFEDDIVIKNVNLLKRKVNKLIDTDFDVLMLSGNNFRPFEEKDEYNGDYIKVSKCFTTGAMIIKKHYYDTWLNNLKEGVEILMRTGDRNYSLDMYNHKLQQKDNWFLVTPICAYQKPDYSDIENNNVNYMNLLLNYDK